MDDKVLTIEQAAELLQITPHSLKKLYLKGDLPIINIHRKCIRFSEKAIQAYIQSKTGYFVQKQPEQKP